MTMLTAFILALVFSPQTLTVTIKPATPFQMSFRHDGLLMPNFRWWCDGGIAKNFSASETPQPSTTPDADGRYTYTVIVPGLPAGEHVCWFTSYNDQGETKAQCSATVTTDCITPIHFVVGAPNPIGKPPAVPVDFRVVGVVPK